MPSSDILTKAKIIYVVAETNGLTRQKSTETVEILLELIKQSLESGDDILISGFGKFCVKEKRNRRERILNKANSIMIEKYSFGKIVLNGVPYTNV